MRYAILGDIHANRAALDAVLADAAELQVDRYACVGDVVGYNADPVYCAERVRELVGEDIVRGNHDHYCMGETPLTGFHPLAAAVVSWTRQVLSQADKEWLGSLPYTCKIDPAAEAKKANSPRAFQVRQPDPFLLVHGTLDMPELWGYTFDKLQAESSFHYQLCQVCFFGHTHVPIGFEKSSVVRGGLYSKLKILEGRKYFINVGSVGQPRDGDPRAAYVIYDTDQRMVELRRIPYDIAATQARIREQGLPERAAARLAVGK